MSKQQIYTIQIDGTRYRYIDTKHDESPSPCLCIVPGWNQTIEVWLPAIEELDRLGYRTVMIEAPHGVSLPLPTPPEALKHIPPIMVQKALAHIHLLDELGIKQTDVIAQSQGGIDSLVATLMRPKLFHNIILFNPAGMVGPDTLPFLLGRFTLEALRDILLHIKHSTNFSREDANQRIAWQMLKHPVKSTRSAYAITKIRLEELIELIRTQCDSQIVCIAGSEDTLFPIEKMRTRASLETLGGFLTVKGNHVDIFRRPHIYMGLAYHLLTAMRQLERVNGL